MWVEQQVAQSSIPKRTDLQTQSDVKYFRAGNKKVARRRRVTLHVLPTPDAGIGWNSSYLGCGGVICSVMEM